MILLLSQNPLPDLPCHYTHQLGLFEKTHLVPLLATANFTVCLFLNWLLWAVMVSAVWVCRLLLWPFRQSEAGAGAKE